MPTPSKSSPCVGIRTCSDYSPFGVELDGRTVSGGYRYGFNTQEKTDEISGSGNHTTALYWEYDSRLSFRWNRDPKIIPTISDYSINSRNPIFYMDPNGDFNKKFGANVYKLFHGGEVAQAEIGPHKGEWYVKNEGLQKINKRGGMYQDANGELTASDITVSRDVSWSWIKTKEMKPASSYDYSQNVIQGKFSEDWDYILNKTEGNYFTRAFSIFSRDWGQAKDHEKAELILSSAPFLRIGKLVVPVKYFHRTIKPEILKATQKGYEKYVGRNPDIHIEEGKIILRGTGQFKKREFPTNLDASDFF